MKRDPFRMCLSVSFATCESDNVLSSILLLCLSSLFSKTLENCKSQQLTHSSSSSPSVDDFDLPDDAWVEVLCRLPPKDMVRFKLVSKSWNLLISVTCIPKIKSPLFGLFLPSGGGGGPEIWDFACCVEGTGTRNNGPSFVTSCFRTLPLTPSPTHFLDCCRGLLLFFHVPSFRFYVCNPSTQQYFALPRAPLNQVPLVASLIPFKPHFHLVWLLSNPFRLLVYYSNLGKWLVHYGILIESCNRAAAECSSPGVLIRGVLYFLSTTARILKIDYKHECSTVIKLPNAVNVKGPNDMGCIGLSANRLHYAWVDRITHHLFVWKLRKHRWVFKHSFSLLDLAKYSMPAICEDFSLLAPYSFHPTSDVLFLGHEVGIFRYDPATKKLDCVHRLRNGTTISCDRLKVFPFSQSLTAMTGFRSKRRGMRKSAATAT